MVLFSFDYELAINGYDVNLHSIMVLFSYGIAEKTASKMQGHLHSIMVLFS